MSRLLKNQLKTHKVLKYNELREMSRHYARKNGQSGLTGTGSIFQPAADRPAGVRKEGAGAVTLGAASAATGGPQGLEAAGPRSGYESTVGTNSRMVSSGLSEIVFRPPTSVSK